jgi:hypothetical protein
VKEHGPHFEYVNVAGQLMAHPTQCPDINSPCHAWLWRRVEAASISLDLANAEASIERIRRSVAWG